MLFKNLDYDAEDFLLNTLAHESPTFRAILEGMLADTGADLPTQTVWCGTLPTAQGAAQIQIRFTTDQTLFTDEG